MSDSSSDSEDSNSESDDTEDEDGNEEEADQSNDTEDSEKNCGPNKTFKVSVCCSIYWSTSGLPGLVLCWRAWKGPCVEVLSVRVSVSRTVSSRHGGGRRGSMVCVS